MLVMPYEKDPWSGHSSQCRTQPQWGSPAQKSLEFWQSLGQNSDFSVSDSSQDWSMHLDLKSPLDMLFNILINRAAVPEQVHTMFQWNKTIYYIFTQDWWTLTADTSTNCNWLYRYWLNSSHMTSTTQRHSPRLTIMRIRVLWYSFWLTTARTFWVFLLRSEIKASYCA